MIEYTVLSFTAILGASTYPWRIVLSFELVVFGTDMTLAYHQLFGFRLDPRLPFYSGESLAEYDFMMRFEELLGCLDAHHETLNCLLAVGGEMIRPNLLFFFISSCKV